MNDNQPLAGCRILVIEDEYFIADDLNYMLGTHGAEVIGPIGTFDKAMKQVERDGFEVAILDINLHDELAYSIADELRRQNVPFLFATGYAASAIPARFAGVKRWEKPYNLRELLDDIRHMCPKLASAQEPPRAFPPS